MLFFQAPKPALIKYLIKYHIMKNKYICLSISFKIMKSIVDVDTLSLNSILLNLPEARIVTHSNKTRGLKLLI